MIIDIEKSTGFSEAGKKKLIEAQGILNEVLDSEIFCQKVLAAKFTQTKLSNPEILMLMRADKLVRVSRYYKWWSRVVGYVSGAKDRINVNGKFFDSNTAVEAASNLLHEYAHIQGFSHYQKPWTYTVPYQMNRILEETYEQIQEEKKQQAEKV